MHGSHSHSHLPAGHDRRPWLVLALLAVAQFMVILDVTVVNVALPDIGADLALSRTALTWTVTAYTLLFGGLMLLRVLVTHGRPYSPQMPAPTGVSA